MADSSNGQQKSLSGRSSAGQKPLQIISPSEAQLNPLREKCAPKVREGKDTCSNGGGTAANEKVLSLH